MAKNNKGRIPIQNPTPKTTVSRDHTGSDPLIRNLRRTNRKLP